MLVEIDETENPVIGQEHVRPGAQAADPVLDGPVPAGDAGHAPRIADFRLEEPVDHVGPVIGSWGGKAGFRSALMVERGRRINIPGGHALTQPGRRKAGGALEEA
ncbi:hypothetical protein MAE02_39120 [Microvirga aerophila]|uniref:Uncharacterized protein n=1 Tax=Microvirga aerophila TaxID=670291 RepID=A0A512BW83_9HYPH|nr:hypothetical protein MAE02_39120 [Microvirga aerophila]